MEQLVVRCFAVPDDFLFFQPSRGRKTGGRLLFNVQLGDIIAAEDSEPTLLSLRLDDFVH